MAVKRVVDINFWNDEKVMEQFTPEDKLFMLYLLTNPHTTQLGVYAINKKIMAFELGFSPDTINVLIDRFENKYQMIKYSNETREIAIKNYLKYSIIKGGKPVEDCLEKEIKQVKDKSLLVYIFNNIINYSNINITVNNIINKYNNILNNNDNEDTSTYRTRIVENKKNFEEEFEELWKLYPKKNGKKKSFDYYIRARKKGVEFETIKLGIEKYIDFIQRTKTSLQYVKDGSTWFNQECWNDERNIEGEQQELPQWFNQRIEQQQMTEQEQQELDNLLKNF